MRWEASAGMLPIECHAVVKDALLVMGDDDDEDTARVAGALAVGRDTVLEELVMQMEPAVPDIIE